MTKEEKMVWAAAFGAEIARMHALAQGIELRYGQAEDSARRVAAEAVRALRTITLYESEGDWRGDKAMVEAMQAREPAV